MQPNDVIDGLEETMFIRICASALLAVAVMGIGVVLFAQRQYPTAYNHDWDQAINTRLSVERLTVGLESHERRITALENRPSVEHEINKLAAEMEAFKFWAQGLLYALAGVSGAGGLIASRRKKRPEEKGGDA